MILHVLIPGGIGHSGSDEARAAQAAGMELRDVHISEPSLETLFLHHTGRSLRD